MSVVSLEEKNRTHGFERDNVKEHHIILYDSKMDRILEERKKLYYFFRPLLIKEHLRGFLKKIRF